MTTTHRFLAFDFGAESGRAVLATLENGRFSLEELHRFPTQGLTMLGVRQWDIARFSDEMMIGLRKAAAHTGGKIDAVGCDTWGVDFGLIARDGTILANPVHYRDARNDGMLEEAFKIVPREELYKRTGIQFMQFNSLFQLLSMVKADSPLFEVAENLLFMGDLLGYILCGERACEYSMASTSQMLNPATRTWDGELLAKLGIPRRLLLDPVKPGTKIGTLLPAVAKAAGLNAETPVIAPATHDTGSAVAAVPATGEPGDWAYLSCGTWSLLGAELPEPVVNDAALAANFTNEGGAENTIRFLKNIFGLWLVQECRRSWLGEGQAECDYATLTAEAEASEPFKTIFNVEDPRLLAPENMPVAIREICAETGEPVPQTRGAMIRACLESLALCYRRKLADMDAILGRKTSRLHIIGGGVQNRLLCRMTADACAIPVLAGPIEATALGNVALQAIGAGVIKDMAEARKIIAASFPIERFDPEAGDVWAEIDARRAK